VALPLVAAWLVLQPTTPVLNALILTPPLVFTVLTLRMRIIKVESTSEMLKLRLIYAPAYRIVRAAGLIVGVVVSLLRGLRVKPQNLSALTSGNPV
jgi:hypothetical protein